MTADVRDRLRKLTEAREKATPGPWACEQNFTGGWAVARAKIEDANGTPVHTPSGWTPYDAAAIVAAHNELPWLVAALTAVLDLADRHEKTARHRRTLAEKWQEQDRWQLASAFRTLARQSDVEAARIRAAVAAAGDQP